MTKLSSPIGVYSQYEHGKINGIGKEARGIS